MQNFPNSATRMQSRHAVLRPRFQTFQADQNHLQQQEAAEGDIDDPDSDTAPVEYEVIYGDEDENVGKASVVETAKQYQQDTIVPTNAKPAQWTRPAIYYLIGFYKHLARSESLGRSSFGPTAIWTEVSRKLLQRGYTCTPEQCRTKWLLLKKLYQHITNESQIQKFDFLETMHEYLKNPRIENLLQDMKSKVEEETVAKRRGIKRKHVKEEYEREEYCLEEDNAKAPSTPTLSNNDVDGIMDIEAEINDVSADMEENLVEQSTQCSIVPGELVCDTTEEYNIVIERQEEPSSHYEGTVSNEEQPALNCLQISDDTHETFESYLEKLKDLIELQEHRRNERHNAKLQMFREYNERLLSQQEAAITLHKKLMERLIDSL